MLLPLACLKRYFLEVLQRLSEFLQHQQAFYPQPQIGRGKMKISVHLLRSPCPINLKLFEKSSLQLFSKIKLDELDFWSILNLIFAGYTGSKNQVRNRVKIQFVELDFLNLIFQNAFGQKHFTKSGFFETDRSFLSNFSTIF